MIPIRELALSSEAGSVTTLIKFCVDALIPDSLEAHLCRILIARVGDSVLPSQRLDPLCGRLGPNNRNEDSSQQ